MPVDSPVELELVAFWCCIIVVLLLLGGTSGVVWLVLVVPVPFTAVLPDVTILSNVVTPPVLLGIIVVVVLPGNPPPLSTKNGLFDCVEDTSTVPIFDWLVLNPSNMVT